MSEQQESDRHGRGDAVVRVTDITKQFRMGALTVHVLQGISLAVEPGEMVAIVGPSGSGKSTLLGLIGGLDTPTSGRVEIDGVDISAMGENQLADIRSEKIGFVFQAYNLIPTLTALENVALPAQFARHRSGKPVPRKDGGAIARARELLDLLGLGDRLGHRPGELSGGQQQRVAIARALINRPVVLLADEPTGNLDSAVGEQVLAALAQARRETSTTLVLVTHDPAVAGLAERIIRLEDGRLAGPVATGREART
jgi:putative ABC transport system ATP-binding protein